MPSAPTNLPSVVKLRDARPSPRFLFRHAGETRFVVQMGSPIGTKLSNGEPLMMELAAQALYSGVLVGGSYALIALGLALVFGTMKVINLAHGELVLLAAYIAYTVESRLGLNPVFAIPVALVLVCLSAMLVYFLISLIKKDRELNSLILTYGLGVILTNAVLLIWSADVHTSNSAWFQEAVVVGPLYSM